MSLGVESLWRARCCFCLVQGHSLFPGEFRYLLFGGRSQARYRLFSSAAASSVSASSSPVSSSSAFFSSLGGLASGGFESRKPNFVEDAGRTPQADVDGEGRGPTLGNMAPTASPTARGRISPRDEAQTRVLGPRAAAAIDPPAPRPGRPIHRRNLRKHIASARRQALVEYARWDLRKPRDDWRWTLNFMIRHTPKVGEVLDFKVRIGRGTAAQARAAFSELDTTLWQLQQRHHCKIHIESGLRGHEPLILNLSGASVSIHKSLSELTKAVGPVLGVRVLDSSLPISWPEKETDRDRDQGAAEIRVPSHGNSVDEVEPGTIARGATAFAEMAQRPKHRIKLYRLMTRADRIPRPAVWTKSSFERYVAELTFARVPTHLHRALYPVGLSHQATVVQLLTGLFCSEELRGAASASALKMALHYIQARGPMFRPAARAIFYQAELRHLPLDAETFQTFLTSASRARDLQAFNSILTAMYRKGHSTQPAAWISFLPMIRDPRMLYHTIRRMRSRGLLRLRPILEQIGRQRAVLHLERHARGDSSIRQLLDVHDRWYGRSWLDTMTLNRMVDVLAARGNLGACYDLLDLTVPGGRLRADEYTLNTMITHTRGILRKAALLSRWPGLEPDGVTYQQLFQAAWRQRLPNVLRVVWRYSVFAGLTNSLMRHTLTKFMRADSAAGKNDAVMNQETPVEGKPTSAMSESKKHNFLKAWEDVILGPYQPVAGQPKISGAAQLIRKYMDKAGPVRPLVPLESKIREAYDLDMKIHALNRQGVEITPIMRKSLTVKINVGIKERQ
ncbi:hypothetical protein F5Y14DRAFT_214857 [Nemania sp. NC0429]|nr:hypothetical protein F5Y14DRAFT_214857 [Nemania sp. NC0429]